jgi:hypothetical protein
MHRKSRYPLRAWATVDRPQAVKNLPPYCYIASVGSFNDATVLDHYEVRPDVDAALLAVMDSDLPCTEQVEYQRPTYRGLLLDVNDHGNVTLLYRFANGNTREIWGVV